MTHIDGYGTDRIGCTTSNMPNAYDIIRALSDVHQASSEPDGLIEDFASAFGWRPSDLITTNGSSGERPSLHVLVEQGLLNTAAISFFPESLSSSFLQRDQRRDLIGISYNNIVDWHVWVETDRVRYIFNRTDPPSEIASLHFSRSDYSALDYERFERAVADAPNADVPALDDAL